MTDRNVMTDMSTEAMKLALEGAANYIDALGGDSRKYRQALANEALERMAENARELGLDCEPAQQTIHCKHRRENNGVCPYHNLHCGWPKCNEPEQPAQQEPVAWMVESRDGRHFIFRMHKPIIGEGETLTPLYEFPPAQRHWVGLTDQEIEQGCKESWVTEEAWQSTVWWAENKLRSKNENSN